MNNIPVEQEEIFVLTFPNKGSYVAAFWTEEGALDLNLYYNEQCFTPDPKTNIEYFVRDFFPSIGTCVLCHVHPETGMSFGLWPDKKTLDVYVEEGNKVVPTVLNVGSVNELNMACGISGVNDYGEPIFLASTVTSLYDQ